MRVLAWLLRAALFLVALAFALSNTRTAEMRFIGFDAAWSAPLVVFLLTFFVAGLVVGLAAVVPTWYRQRREIASLRRRIDTDARAPASVPTPTADVPAPETASPVR
jgi:putative membrane protein